MSIDSVPQTGSPGGHFPYHRAAPSLTGTANMLGLSPGELQNLQKSGKTLAEIAAAKGVAKADLVKSIAADLHAGAPNGSSLVADAQLSLRAAALADARRPSRTAKIAAPQPEASTTSSAAGTLTALADALGLTPAKLTEKIKSIPGLSSLMTMVDSSYTATGAARGGAGSTGSTFESFA